MQNPLTLPYYQLHDFMVRVCGQDVRCFTKPGLPNWDEVAPAVKLLAETISMGKVRRVLLMGCGNGVLGAVLCRQQRVGDLVLMDTNWVALRVARATMAANGFAGVPVEPLQYPLPVNTYDMVAILLPKGRKLARRWLVEAWSSLLTGGELYLAGANSEGIQSVTKDAGSLFGNATVLAFRKGCRVVRMVKQHTPEAASDLALTANTITQADAPKGEQAPAWTADPGIARGSWIEFMTEACGENFSVRSLPGVFSYDQVDEGTELLLHQLTTEQVQGKRVLDFGCGYGLIGMAASHLGAERVDLLDVDQSAVDSAQENCTRNQILNAQVRSSDVLDAVGSERFNLILSNPPFHAGKKVEYDITETFIAHSHFSLSPGGSLILVANRFIRYDRVMKAIFGNVGSLVETGKYHVLESVR